MPRNRADVDINGSLDEDGPSALDALFDHAEPRRSPLVRLLRGLLVLAVVAGLAFFGGGGWYFSGQIEDGALAVKREAPVDDLHLAPHGHGTVAITTDDAGDRAVLEHGATYGLAWDGGYGQLTGPAQAGPHGAVVRDLTVLAGGSPTAGTLGHLDRSAFPDDPRRALGRSVQEVTYRSGGADLPAWFVPGQGDNTAGTWAVLVHGKGVTRTEMLRLMRDTVAAGLPSLAVSYRNDVGAPRDPSGRYQYGRTEWHDLAAALRYARARGADHVVLLGASMGGAVIASYLEHTGGRDLPVSGLVLDAPMLDLGSTVQYGARQRPLPVLGHVPDPLTWTAEQIAAVRYRLDWSAVDYLDDSSWLREPALVVHGTADSTVPLHTSRELAAEHPGQVRLLTVPGAEHVESWNVDPHRYDTAVRAFLAEVSR